MCAGIHTLGDRVLAASCAAAGIVEVVVEVGADCANIAWRLPPPPASPAPVQHAKAGLGSA
eukprot:7635211-Pyramimonas_sp.AAC.1